MKISFVTTCKGRLFHLKETYIKNIETALKESKDVEFVLVNYDSPDGMDVWVKTELKEYLERKIVTYIYVTPYSKYSHPHSTNIGYRYTSGDLIVTLEADNFFCEGFVTHILNIFTNSTVGYAWFPGFIKGATSRLVVRKEYFLMVNGYEESLKGWGFDDTDLRKRLSLYNPNGFTPLDVMYAGVIEHKDIYRKKFNEFGFLPLFVTNLLNQIKSLYLIKKRGFSANQGHTFGSVN